MFEAVHYWNESGHSESVISNGCCPTSQWSNEIPSADDYTVAWRSYDRVGSEGIPGLSLERRAHRHHRRHRAPP